MFASIFESAAETLGDHECRSVNMSLNRPVGDLINGFARVQFLELELNPEKQFNESKQIDCEGGESADGDGRQIFCI